MQSESALSKHVGSQSLGILACGCQLRLRFASGNVVRCHLLKAVSGNLAKGKLRKAIISFIHTNSMIVDTNVPDYAVDYVCGDTE